MILLFDDERDVRENFRKEISGQAVGLSVLECSSKDELKANLAKADVMAAVKVLIFDLSTSKEEAQSGKFEVLEYIKKNYENYALPIFIHSAFAEIIVGYDNLGTLFKIKKAPNSITEISSKIKLFQESGFLNIFRPNGSLEIGIHKEIINAFNRQFFGNEIALIIESIKKSNPTELVERTKTVFERIAIRTLYQNLLSAKRLAETNEINEIKINAVEHYYRRESDFEIWTGDIFENLGDNKSQVVVLTPRCDINNGVCKDRFLVCYVEKLDGDLIKKMSKDVNKYLTDNPQQSGIKSRFLIPAPNYIGGKVDLTNYFFVTKDEFIGQTSKYRYLISLSDELTNEIVRKFSYYILRGGISASDLSEASFYSMNVLNE